MTSPHGWKKWIVQPRKLQFKWGGQGPFLSARDGSCLYHEGGKDVWVRNGGTGGKTYKSLLGNNKDQCLRNLHLLPLLPVINAKSWPWPCCLWSPAQPCLSFWWNISPRAAVLEDLCCWRAVLAAWAISLTPRCFPTKTLLTASTSCFYITRKKKKSTTSTTLREDGDAIASRNTLWQERNLKYVTVRAGQKVLFCLLSTSLCSFWKMSTADTKMTNFINTQLAVSTFPNPNFWMGWLLMQCGSKGKVPRCLKEFLFSLISQNSSQTAGKKRVVSPLSFWSCSMLHERCKCCSRDAGVDTHTEGAQRLG